MSEKIFNQLDDEFEHYLDSVQFETTEVELTPQLKAQRRKIADNDDFQFCKIYFPSIYRDDFNALHHYINACTTGFYTVSGSRRFGKSAFTYITKLIKPLCAGGLGYVGLGLRTQKLAIARTFALTRLIKRNKMLMYDYSIEFQRDKMGDYLINNKSFMGFGYDEGIRNVFDEEFNRFDIIVVDDLFHRNSVKSDVDNEKVYDFVTSECTGQLTPGGLLLWLFNYVSPKSPGKKYADAHPDTHFNLPALNEKGETNWPGSFWTTEELIALRDSLPFAVWMGDYMNNPLEKGDMFNKDWLSTINLNLVKIIASVTGVDPSHGQSPAACDKAAVTIGIDDKGKGFITDIYARKEGFPEFFDYLYQVRLNSEKHKAVLWENDFAQWDYAAEYYNNWTKQNKTYLPLILFNAKDNKSEFYGSDKDSRIMSLIFPFQKGVIKISQAITGTHDYIIWESEYIGFGTPKVRLDALDATASAWIMLPRYIETGSFKSLGNRQFKQEETSWLKNR